MVLSPQPSSLHAPETTVWMTSDGQLLRSVFPPLQSDTETSSRSRQAGFEQISEPTLGEHWSGPLHCPLSIALQIVVEHVDGSHGLVSAVERRTREKSTSRPERRAIWRASG